MAAYMFPDHAEPTAAGASRVGAELSEARQRLGWQLPDVATMLRIRLPYLQAIEDGRVEDLPGSAYAVGFLRTYASALGLDADEVARRFRAESSEINKRPELSFPAPVPDRGVPAGAVVLLGVVLAVGAYVGWYHFSGDTQHTTQQVPPLPDRLAAAADRATPPPPPAAAAAVPVAPSPPVQAVAPPPMPVPIPVPVTVPSTSGATTDTRPDTRMLLRVKADTWINVRERQGPVLLNRVMRAGESWPVPQRPQIVMTTGNAGATELLVDGALTPSLGSLGVVRRDVPLDPDLVKAGRTGAASTTTTAPL